MLRKILFALALSVLASGCATRQPSEVSQETIQSVERGRAFVRRGCAGCHAVGEAGHSPDTAAPPFRTVLGRRTEPELARLLADISQNGHRQMPPIYMSDREITDIVAYIRSVRSDGAEGSARPFPGARTHRLPA